MNDLDAYLLYSTNEQLSTVQKIASDLPPFGENPPVGAPEPDTDDDGM